MLVFATFRRALGRSFLVSTAILGLTLNTFGCLLGGLNVVREPGPVVKMYCCTWEHIFRRERKKSVWADVRYTHYRNRQGHQQLVEHGAEEKCIMIFVDQQFSDATQ